MNTIELFSNILADTVTEGKVEKNDTFEGLDFEGTLEDNKIQARIEYKSTWSAGGNSLMAFMEIALFINGEPYIRSRVYDGKPQKLLRDTITLCELEKDNTRARARQDNAEWASDRYGVLTIK